MDWPETPVEQIDPEAFFPPFCPWPACSGHRPDSGTSLRFQRHGCYTRLSPPRVVPRFRCLDCHRTFSQQTFSTTYYLKRPELLAEVAAGLNAGSAHRQLGRSLGCAGSTVTRLAARLGRHALLMHALTLQHVETLTEPIVYDDFESFAHSQDLPFGLGTAVGQDSWLVYALQFAPHRRPGRPRKRRRRKACKSKPARGSYRKAFTHTLDLLLERRDNDRPLVMISDGHPGYKAGLSRHHRRHEVDHRVFPNPKRGPGRRSPEARVRDEQMFSVDLLHKLIRHSLAHHRRETIAFGQRHNALLERAFLMVVWRNFVKARTERKPDPTTPAMYVGLTDEPWSWPRALAQRLFATRVALPEPWQLIYQRAILTEEIGINRSHLLRHAY